jgi:hypothetical protein
LQQLTSWGPQRKFYLAAIGFIDQNQFSIVSGA